MIEHIPRGRRLPGVALVLRATDDGRAVHRVAVRSSVEEAAGRIRRALERRAARMEEREQP